MAPTLELDVLCTISDLEAGRDGVDAGTVVDAMAGSGRTPETMDELLASLVQRHLIEARPGGSARPCEAVADRARRTLRLTRRGCDALALGAAGWFVEPASS